MRPIHSILGAIPVLAILDLQLATIQHITGFGAQTRCTCSAGGVTDWSPSGDFFCSDIKALCPSNTYVASLYSSSAGGYFGECGTDTNRCSLEKHFYDVKCGKCPAGYVPQYVDSRNCGWQDDLCVACTGPDEVLVGKARDIAKGGPDPNPFTCVSTCTGINSRTGSKRSCPLKCPTQSTVSSPYLSGPQVVVSSTFEADINHLISCARAAGASTKPNLAGIVGYSTSRCGKSPSSGLTPAKGISLHQTGRAIDIYLKLPSGRVCQRDCIGKAYCAFNKTRSSCKTAPAAIQGGDAKNADNILVRDFIKCAGSTGLMVGASFLPAGDWNHFSREVSNRQVAMDGFRPQLQNFCLSKCEGLVKGAVTEALCNCAGFS